MSGTSWVLVDLTKSRVEVEISYSTYYIESECGKHSMKHLVTANKTDGSSLQVFESGYEII